MANPEHDPDAIVQQVLSRYRQRTGSARVGMARTTLVVDENLAGGLSEALKGANFHVINAPKGMLDIDIKTTLLAHRILVTNNTQDFLADAPVLDYGIIGLEALRYIDREREYGKNQTAQLISTAVSEHNLISKRSGYVLMLKPDGRHVLRDLE